MADKFKLSVEVAANANQAIKAFDTTTNSAQKFEGALNSANAALKAFQTQQGKSNQRLSDRDIKTLERTLPLYQKAASAVGQYARSVKSLNEVSGKGGSRKAAQALAEMNKQLRGMSTLSEKQVKDISRTLGVMRQLTSTYSQHTAALKNQAAAIREVANARKADADAAGRPAANTALANQRNAAAQESEARSARAGALAAKRTEEADQRIIASKSRVELARQREARMAEQTAQKVATAERNRAEVTSRSMASTRYALYEVAATYTAIAAATGGFAIAGARSAIDQQRQFADVVKVTSQEMTPALVELRSAYRDLSTEIPITFEELTKIGVLGAQMGVAEAHLDSFSETVAKFVATSQSVTAETAAMSFGRLSNMIDDIEPGKFDHLASAISEVGTASVATEGEILSNAESIATTANMAGFGADQVVGLATALASVRVRPEMARGAMQRIFAKINAAVADGGEELQNWAQMAGLSADAAGRMWREDPSQFFQRVNSGLSEMDDNITRNIAIREDLGVTNVRDIELLSRLSNGYETYAASMSLAGDAYARGDFLDRAAAPIFESTAASLQRLSNAWQNFLASMGEGGLQPIAVVADTITALLNAVSGMPAPLRASAMGFFAVVGALFAFRAAVALGGAALIAYRQVQQQLHGQTYDLLRSLLGLSGGFHSVTGASTRAAGGFAALRVQAAQTTGVLGTMGIAARGAGLAIRSIPLVGWAITLAGLIPLIHSWATSHDDAAESVRAHAEALASAGGGFESFNRAILEDQQAIKNGADTIAEYEVSVRRASTAQSEAAGKSGVYITTQGDIGVAVEDATRKVQNQTIAIGENGDAWLRNALVNADAVQENKEAMRSLVEDYGFSLDRYLETFYADGQAGADKYLDGIEDKLRSDLNRFNIEDMKPMGELVELFRNQANGLTGIFDDFEYQTMLLGNAGVDSFEDLAENADAAGDKVDDLNQRLSDLTETIFGLANAEASASASLQSLGESLADNGMDFAATTEAGRANLDALTSHLGDVGSYFEAEVARGRLTADEATAQYAQYVEAILNQLEQMGVDPKQFVDFRNQLEFLFAENPVLVNVDTTAALANLQNLAAYGAAVFASLRGQGVSKGMSASGARYAAQGAAHNARNGRATTGHGITVLPPSQVKAQARSTAGGQRFDFGGLEAARAAQATKNLAERHKDSAKAAEKAGKAGKKAGDDTKTAAEQAADYVKRLGEAFNESFTRRYGVQQASDAVEQQLHNMRNAVTSAKDEVQKLRDEYRKLNQEASDARIDERQANLFAGVAARYGDTERFVDYTNQAQAARDTAAEKTRLAAAAKKEADAIQQNMYSLTGNTEQAIKNRAAVYSLQQEMGKLIAEYARSGATQEQVRAYAENLRRKFIDQSVQMGYNKRDVQNLSLVFQDYKRDIERVPLRVTTKATADTAQANRDINDFSRRLADLAKQNINVPVNLYSKDRNLNITGDLRVKDVVAHQLKGHGPTGMMRIASPYARGGIIPGKAPQTRSMDNLLGVGAYDGLVSVQAGEGIVNHRALQHYGGADWLNAVNNMSLPQIVMAPSAGGNGGGASSSAQLVEILPHQINQIARAVSTVLAIDGKVVAGTTNGHNTAQARRGAH